MKLSKKFFSVLLATIICISSLAVCNLSAYAAGWVDKVQEIEVNETITDSLNASNVTDNLGILFFKCTNLLFQEKGTVRLRVESNDVNLGYGYYSYGLSCFYRIYNVKKHFG